MPLLRFHRTNNSENFEKSALQLLAEGTLLIFHCHLRPALLLRHFL